MGSLSRAALAQILAVYPNSPAAAGPGETLFRPDVTVLGVAALPPAGSNTVWTAAQGEAVLRLAMEQAIAAGAPTTIRLYDNAGTYPYIISRPTNATPQGDDVADVTGLPVVRIANGLAPIITLEGGNATGRVVIRRVPDPASPVQRYRLLAIDRAGEVQLANLSLENGDIAGEGGAVLARETADPLAGDALQAKLQIRNCRFFNNFAGNRGGGLSVANLGVVASSSPGLTLDITTTEFQQNTAAEFGGGGAYVERAATSITGCTFTDNLVGTRPGTIALNGFGGGLYFNNGATQGGENFLFRLSTSPAPTFKYTRFVQNRASSGGGAYLNGVTNRDSSGAEIAGFVVTADFVQNTATNQGGGLFVNEGDHRVISSSFGITRAGDLPDDCDRLLLTATPVGNTAREGGGAYIRGFSGRFIRCRFHSNTAVSGAQGSGGGAFIDAKSEVLSFEECGFKQNTAVADGGGAKTRGASVPVFDDCVFDQNSAARGGGLANGDALVGNSPNSLIYNCVFTRNTGTESGGGIYIANSQPKIVHTTIAGNRVGSGTGPFAGFGVHIADSQSQTTVLNSIIYANRRSGTETFATPTTQNTSFSFGVSTTNSTSFAFPRVRFSLVDDTRVNTNPVGGAFAGSIFPNPAEDSAAEVACLGPSTNSNINANPQFVHFGAGNVHLRCPSPAIDRASYLRGRKTLLTEALAGRIPFISQSDPSINTLIDAMIDDYDDICVTGASCAAEFSPNPLGDEPCPSDDRLTNTYPNGNAVQCRTPRPYQCQADMGADESVMDISVNPLVDKLVCVNGDQSFDVAANCDPLVSGDGPIAVTFQWCKIDPTIPNDPGVVLTNGAHFQITAPGGSLTSRLTINDAVLTDNAIYKVKIDRSNALGRFVKIRQPSSLPGSTDEFPLPSCTDGSPVLLQDCPPAMAQARLYVFNGPTAATGGNATVCTGGSQELVFTTTIPIVPLNACNGTITVTKNGVTITLPDPRITETAYIPNPDGVTATKTIRISFTNAQLADCATYAVQVACSNLAAGKCAPATASATLCVTPPPTVTGDPDKIVCVGGSQTLNFVATFPVSSCTICNTASCTPSVVIKKDNVALPAGRFVCDPINAQRQILCRVLVNPALESDAGQYCIEASCSNLNSAKCGVSRYCANLCVIPAPSVFGDPDKTICTGAGNSQTLNFTAVFPLPALPQFCPATTCTQQVVIKKDGVLLSTGRYTCDPINAQRQINCRVNFANPALTDAGEYCIEASCTNLTGGKCGTARYCARLCVINPPTVSADPNKVVCVGGDQTLNFTATFPATPPTSVAFCPTSPCTPTVVLLKNGVVLPPSSYVCDPINAQRQILCRIRFNPANMSNAGEYCIEASCGILASKCGPVRACTNLCVIQPPQVSGDPDRTVCIGPNNMQTLNWTVTIPAAEAGQICPTTICTPVIVVKKNNVALPTNRYVCDPINAQRQINCRLNFTNPIAGDAGQYCLEASCSNLTGGKCGTAAYCINLCVIDPPTVTADPNKVVCIGGDQTINFTATFPSFSCTGSCTQTVTMFKDNVALPPARYTCDPINAQRQIFCRIRFNPAVDSDQGQYCLEASCSNLAALGKCAPARACANLTVLPPPTINAIPDRKVCAGSNACFTVNFTAPAGCTPSIVVKKGDVVLALGSHYTLTGSGTSRTFCINNAQVEDCGLYEICVGCGNLAEGKCIEACAEFRLEVLPPPTLTLSGDPNARVCAGTDYCFNFNYTAGGPCPTIAGPTPFEITCRKVNGAGAGPIVNGGRFRCEPGANPNTWRLCVTAVTIDDTGDYEVCIRYTGLDPLGVCQNCVRVRLDVDDLRVDIIVPPACIDQPYTPPESPEGMCAIITSGGTGPFTFQWYICNPDGSMTPIDGATSQCYNFGGRNITMDDFKDYKVLVTPPPGSSCTPIYSVCKPLRQRPPEECNCVCCWDNGRYDGQNGTLSAKPFQDEFPNVKAAADFYLPAGEMHLIKKWSAVFLTNNNPALPYKAKLTLFEDCDGCPGEEIAVFDQTSVRLGATDAEGLRSVEFTFAPTKLWLRGGKTYWISIQGLSDLSPGYEAYWGTSGGIDPNLKIMGSVPKKMGPNSEAWLPLDECCIDCTELNFCLECDSCKIVHDNGTPELPEHAGGTRSERSVSNTRNSRSADQFVIAPCMDIQICYIEGYIYTNCDGFNTWLELYADNCGEPNFTVVPAGTPYFRWQADKIEDLGYTVTIDGVLLSAYKVSFCPTMTQQFPMGLVLHGGQNYWLSLAIEDSFSLAERGYFAFNRTDCDDCPVMFAPGQQIAPGRNINTWTSTAHDYAFLLAGRKYMDEMPPPAPGPANAACPQDVDGNGQVTVQDMFDFLSAWFSGCP